MGFLIRIVIVSIIVLLFGYFVLYNNKIMRRIAEYQEKSESIFFKHVGKRVRSWNRRAARVAVLNKGSTWFNINKFFEDMIVNLDMVKDDVSVVGLLFFISSISFVLTIFLSYFLGSWGMFLIIFSVFLFFIVVVMRLISITRYEKREAEIMDALDLLVSDIKDGVYNAISRYRNNFHPNIRNYFFEFIDDIQNKGYGFKQAIMILNEKLGHNFTEFTQKAILYEEKADKNMQDIFSSIIDTNRQRRTLRYINAREFADLRIQFIVSMLLIVGFAFFSMVTDTFVYNFFTNTFFGTLLIIVNLAIVSAVIYYLAEIKAKSL